MDKDLNQDFNQYLNQNLKLKFKPGIRLGISSDLEQDLQSTENKGTNSTEILPSDNSYEQPFTFVGLLNYTGFSRLD